MKNLSVPLSFLLFLWSGCSNDNDDISPASEEDLLIIEVDGHYFNNAEFAYLFLTDEGDRTLWEMEIHNDFTDTLRKPEDFTRERMNLHIFTHLGARHYQLISYYGIKQHKVSLESFSFNLRGPFLDNAKVGFENIPPHDHYFFSYSFLHSGTDLESALPFSVPVYENNRDAYIYLRNGSEYSYKVINSLEAGKENLISLADMNNSVEQYSISLPDEGHSSSVNINVSSVPESFLANGFSVYNTAFTDAVDNASELRVTIPTELASYPYRNASVSVRYSTDRYTYHVMDTYGFIPDAFEEINAALTVNTEPAEWPDVSVTGEYDYIRGSFVSSSKRWHFYSDKPEVDFPKIPDAITTRFPDLHFKEELKGTDTFQFDVREYTHINGFDDWIDRALTDEKFILPTEGEHTGYLVRYFSRLNPPGGRTTHSKREISETKEQGEFLIHN